jgi:putative peptidoglycan lipid II flippase
MSRQIRIASLIWGASLLLSRVIGLVREAVLGRVLGTSGEADVYWASFMVPDFLNYLLAAGALSIVFIPIFGGYLARGEEDRGWEAFSVIATFAGSVLLVACAALWFAMPWLVPIVGPGFDEAQAEQLIHLTRIMVPAQIFHILGGLLSAALQARDRHTLPALAPLLYTGSIVAGGLIMGTAEGFAWGVLVGSFLGPFMLPLIGNLQEGLRWRPRWSLRHPDLKQYLWLSLPIMMGMSIVAVDDWFVTHEGSFLPEGAISQLRYAKNLMKVPMGVFGLATGVAAYPTLTRLVAQGRPNEAYQTLAGALRTMLVLAFGSQVVLTVAGADISRVIYGGKVPDSGHETIGLALGILGIGLWAWAAQTVVSRGFYAQKQTWLPTILGTIIAGASYPLYRWLRIEHGVLGLPVATSTAITIYVTALTATLAHRHRGENAGLLRFFVRVIPATAAGIGVGLALDSAVELPWPLLQGAVTGSVGGAVFVVACLILGVTEARTVLAMVGRRILRRKRA